MDRLARKFETIRAHVPAPRSTQDARRAVGLICFGTSHYAAEESRDQLRERARRRDAATCGCGRIRSPPELADFIRRHERVYVVEQNRDAQLLALHAPRCRPER